MKKISENVFTTGTHFYFYYAGEQMIAISNGSTASTLLLWGADSLIGTRSNVSGVVNKQYHLYDTQGNLAQTLDANGAVVSQSAFSAWGEPLRDSSGSQAIAGAFGYGAKFGYWRDGESGFVLCTLRYYDPSGGRWLTRDPIGYAGGSNLYGYVGGDPVNMTDPDGLVGNHISPQQIIRNQGDFQAIRSNIAGAWESTSQGAMAAADGLNFGGDPLADAGYYNPNDYRFSQGAGAVAGSSLAAGGAIVAAPFAGAAAANAAKSPFVQRMAKDAIKGFVPTAAKEIANQGASAARGKGFNAGAVIRKGSLGAIGGIFVNPLAGKIGPAFGFSANKAKNAASTIMGFMIGGIDGATASTTKSSSGPHCP